MSAARWRSAVSGAVSGAVGVVVVGLGWFMSRLRLIPTDVSAGMGVMETSYGVQRVAVMRLACSSRCWTSIL